MTFTSPLTYRYSDLAAGRFIADFAQTAQTVVLMDGEEITQNVGHAYQPGALITYGASVDLNGGVYPGKGTTVSFAATRHKGGANYVFADGHVKWHVPHEIFFPPQASGARVSIDPKTKTPTGPEPGKSCRVKVKSTWERSIYGEVRAQNARKMRGE